MIEIVIRPPRDGSKPLPTMERVRQLAEYVAGLLGPVAVRREGPSQPPYSRDEDGMSYQLDQGNDWFLRAEEDADGSVRCAVDHRYRAAERIDAIRSMVKCFTYYEVRPSGLAGTGAGAGAGTGPLAVASRVPVGAG